MRRLLDGLAPLRAGRALTLLARAALTQPAATGLIRQALTADFAHLAVPALAVAVETNPQVGERSPTSLSPGKWPPDVLNQIARALPDTSVALAHACSPVSSARAAGDLVGPQLAADASRGGRLAATALGRRAMPVPERR